MSTSTGYGPRSRLYFDGDEDKYELWEVKFKGHLRLQKLLSVIEGSGNEDGDAAKNLDVFAELVQVLDDKSLSLIIRDAKDNGREALKILREHYLGSSKPRIISLYTELTSLKMTSSERVTDYMIRAETAATSLKNAGETISDSLLIAMILKGLPDDFKAFSTVVTQKKEDMNFKNFKSSLRSYEESEKCRLASSANDDRVMQMKSSAYKSSYPIKCFKCGKEGHKKFQCRENRPNDDYSKSNRWCNICKSISHDTEFCWKKNSVNYVVNDRPSDENESFAFKISASVPTDELGLGLHNNNVNACNMLVDCGATAHIISNISKFVRLDEDFESSKHFIELADGSRSNGIVSAKGDVNVVVKDSKGEKQNVILKNALCIPSYRQDIFSVQAATENGASVNFSPNSAELKAPDGTAFNITKSGKLYFLNNIKTQRVHSLEEWHKILGHCNVKDVLKLESVADGMKIIGKDDFNCKTCAEGKMYEYRSREPDKRASQRLELIHCDLAGPIDPVSRENSKYAIVFVDDYSGVVFVYFLKNKNDAAAATAKFLADIAPYGSVKRLRSDNGTEFTCSEFKSLMVSNRIKHEFSAPYSPHQNGTAERTWRTLFEMARCLLLEAKLPKKLWNYAVRASAYTRNRCFNQRTRKTPFEMFHGKKPDVSNMHIFGCDCFAYVQEKKKLDPRSEQGVFIGYDVVSPAYLVYFPEKDEVKRIRCVKFHEKLTQRQEDTFHDPSEFIRPTPGTLEDKEAVGTPEVSLENQVEPPKEEIDRRYPQRERNAPKYLKDYVDPDSVDAASCTIDYCYRVSSIPKTYNEAIASPEAHKWQKAMNDEVSSLEDNNTYELVPVPQDRAVVGGRWVYAVKLGPNNEEKFKARYVAKGYSQIENIDYQETFSPTARITSVRMLMQLAVQKNFVVHQMDVKTAYLNANIDCELFVEQPEGFVKTNKSGDQLVCRLNKSLYGLKQSGRNWNNVLHDFLVSLGFVQSFCDHCVYTRHRSDSCAIIIVWVDDLIISASDMNTVNDVKCSLSQKFKMKDLGQLNWFLGIEFQFEDDCIKMNQTKYLERILHRFKMIDCNPKLIPCDIGVDKNVSSDSKILDDPKLYREIVGSLIYVMTCTRPDLCYVVSKLSQYMSKPTNANLNLSKFALKYIKGTLDDCLTFKRSCDNLDLIGFCDSDWGGSIDRRSISGYCFQLNKEGPLISWKSKKQNCVALSSCEAEYVSMTFAIQESKFLQQLLVDMLGCSKLLVNLHVDNQGALELAKNPVHHQRSKHIDVKYHYIRSQIQNSSVILHYVPTDENIADIFTKPVNRTKFNKFKNIRG